MFGWTTQGPVYQEILEGKMRYLPVPDSATFPEGGDEYGRYGAFNWGDVLVIWLDVLGFCKAYIFRFEIEIARWFGRGRRGSWMQVKGPVAVR